MRWRPGSGLRVAATSAPGEEAVRGDGRSEALSRGGILANGLTLARGLLVVPFAAAIIGGSAAHGRPAWLALAIFLVAAATDFIDGRLARASGSASDRGQVLDSAADIIFVGTGLVLFAAGGRIPWLVPAAMAGAVVVYVRDSLHPGRGEDAPLLDRSAIGHAAGVANFALVGLLTVQHGYPQWVPVALVGLATVVTIALNLGSVLQRLAGRSARTSQQI